MVLVNLNLKVEILKTERRWIDSVELITEEERKEDMGAYSNVDVSLPPSYDVVSGPRFCKHVHDNVHGNIYLDPVISNYSWIVSFLESYFPVARKKLKHIIIILN